MYATYVLIHVLGVIYINCIINFMIKNVSKKMKELTLKKKSLNTHKQSNQLMHANVETN